MSNEDPTAVPAGFRAIPLCPPVDRSFLTIFLLVREEPDAEGRRFVLLRSPLGARVYLGGVSDVGGRVHEWAEIWVQTVSGMAGSSVGVTQNLTNKAMDERWVRQAELFRQTDPQGFIQTGFEGLNDGEPVHPLPLFLDAKQAALVQLVGKDGRAWELCRDDALLEGAGLPGFTGSLYRYLRQPEAGQETRFVSLADDAPATDSTTTLEKVIGSPADLVPFNAEGGLLMVRSFCPLSLEEFVEMLSGRPWLGSATPDRAAGPLGPSSVLGAEPPPDAKGEAYLFWGPASQSGRLLEVLHLKLHLLAEVFELVRTGIRKLGMPYLNLSPESFRVKLGQPRGKLPLMWTAKACLATVSQAHAVPIAQGEAQYFMRWDDSSYTDYFPQGIDQAFSSTGLFTITRAREAGDDRVVLEGTVRTTSMLPPLSEIDLLRFGWLFRGELLEFHGHVRKALGKGELLFTTLPRALKPDARAALLSTKVFPPKNCNFEIIPALGPQQDLYALGLLALRVLVVPGSASIQDQANLGETLNALLGLRSQCPPGEVATHIRASLEQDLLAKEPSWLPMLGPHRLYQEEIPPKEALSLVPIESWSQTLAWIVRLLDSGEPGQPSSQAGPEALGAPEAAFNALASALEKLLIQTRSLLLVDWSFNREISSVIQQFRHQKSSQPGD